MRDLLKFILVLFSLYLIETIMVFCLLVFENIYLNGTSNIFVESDWRFIFGITILRIIYFAIPQLLLYLFIKSIIKKYNLKSLIIFNTISFIIIFFAYLLIWTSSIEDYLTKSVTYYFIFSTILSPILLIQIPYFKKLTS